MSSRSGSVCDSRDASSKHTVPHMLQPSAAALAAWPPPLSPPCVARRPDDFRIDFANATTIHSNLGGQGGRQGSTNVSSERVLRLGSIGMLVDGTVVDLEIRNMSDYSPFNADLNGIKYRPEGSCK